MKIPLTIRTLLMLLPFIFIDNANAISERAQIELAHQRNIPVDSNGNIVLNNTEREEEFREFWKGFRSSILKNRWSELDNYIKYPLQTRGGSDYDPIIEVTMTQFKKVFSFFLKSEKVLINDLEEVNPYITDKWVRIGDMQFTRENGEWYLYFIYLNLEELEP